MSDVVLIDWFSAHYYRVTLPDGQARFIPSVTTKLGVVDKPQLARWRGDLGNREADLRMYEGAQKGTRIHWARSVMLNGGAVIYDPWQRPVYTEEGIAELRKQYKEVAILRTQEEMWDICKLEKQLKVLRPEILGVEEMVFDLEQNDAGTIDSILLLKPGEYLVNGKNPLSLAGGVYIEDLKTGHYLDDSVWLQIAAYTVMWEKKHGMKVSGAFVTHTGSSIKTGIPGLATKFCSREELLEYYKKYRHISDVWLDKHEGEQPETFQFPSVVTLNLREAV